MTQTDRQNDARETLANLARMRAESQRGGSDNFGIAHGLQIAVALRASGTTEEEWQALCTQATNEEAERWEQTLVDAEEATAEEAHTVAPAQVTIPELEENHMADIALNAARMSLVTETKPHERFYKANATIEKGQPCYLMSNGFIAPTSAAAVGTSGTFVGIAMGPADANEAISLLWDGSLSGFAIDALAFGTKVYLSDRAGTLSDTPGTVNKAVGVILPLSDLAKTRVLYIQARPF